MKTKYTNFKHWASSDSEAVFTPEHLIRKHWSLQLIEGYHITICLILGISAYISFTKSLFIYVIAFVILFLAFCITALLSINDDYRFRAATLLSHAFVVFSSCIAFVLTDMNLALFVALLTPSPIVLIVVFLLRKNRDYYEWCKSIAGKI